jgi:glycine/D-amino acid oxidase-like deaminating enzyme
VWLLVGLGARGLVYHAWLGQLVAQAVLSNSEQQLPQELLAWRGCRTRAITDAE